MSFKNIDSFTSFLSECLLFLFHIVLTRPYGIIWNSSSRINNFVYSLTLEKIHELPLKIILAEGFL